MSTQEQPITASLVAESQRLDFLTTYFGPRLMMRGEALVYAWLRRLCERYNGAYWHYYTLSDGGFYLAPNLCERLEIEVDGNGFRGELSAAAAGIQDQSRGPPCGGLRPALHTVDLRLRPTATYHVTRRKNE